MEIWDMMINITRAQADKAFREMDYEASITLHNLPATNEYTVKPEIYKD